MNKINNKTVLVSTSSELKDALENDNGYEYIYLENDITLDSGITVNKNKNSVTINGTYQNVMHTLTGMNSVDSSDTIVCISSSQQIKIKKYKNIHMIGIGGVSMSGIAAILKNFGFHVTGSDWVESETTNKLNNLGIHVTIGHSLDDVAKSDAVVYSAAIKQDDPEMLEAKRLHIPTIERADFLGELTRCYQDTICISGTHGKTTTTSMISLCFLEGLQDPSIQVGAFLKQINGNYKVGSSEHFIIEACEYVESFLKFSPKAEIILNIDNDHLDYFKTF